MNVKFKAHLFIFSLFFCYNLSAQEIVKGDFKNENPQSSYVPSFDMDATGYGYGAECHLYQPLSAFRERNEKNH